MIRAVFQMKDMQRLPGKPGCVGRVLTKKCEVDFDMYTNELGLPGYWPTSLMVKVSGYCVDPYHDRRSSCRIPDVQHNS